MYTSIYIYTCHVTILHDVCDWAMKMDTCRALQAFVYCTVFILVFQLNIKSLTVDQVAPIVMYACFGWPAQNHINCLSCTKAGPKKDCTAQGQVKVKFTMSPIFIRNKT